ncbi:hypothetical protein BDR05DRAFT_1018227 [Suillus weaverae]|nr:hypothetical protein BDR05DRAFT_1018227 [Suillus weaverae]
MRRVEIGTSGFEVQHPALGPVDTILHARRVFRRDDRHSTSLRAILQDIDEHEHTSGTFWDFRRLPSNLKMHLDTADDVHAMCILCFRPLGYHNTCPLASPASRIKLGAGIEVEAFQLELVSSHNLVYDRSIETFSNVFSRCPLASSPGAESDGVPVEVKVGSVTLASY